MLIEGHPTTEQEPRCALSPRAITLLDVSMKIKWLLDVCLSPGQDLHLWEVLRDPRTEGITAQKAFMFPRALSHHLMQKVGLPCLAFAH